MATKKTHIRTFNVHHNGDCFTISCYTAPAYDKECGSCMKEHAVCKELGVRGGYTFYNRPWQSFKYDCALSELAEKVGKKHGEELGKEFKALHELIEKEEYERAEQMFGNFEAVFSKASENHKRILRESGIQMNSEEDLKNTTTLIALGNLLGV